MKKTKERLAIFGAFSAFLGISLFLDKPVANIFTGMHAPVLDSFFLFITSLATIGLVILLFSGTFLWKRQPRLALMLIASAAIGLVGGFILKYAFLRPRPEAAIYPLAIENSPSFPSAHASMVSAEVPMLARITSVLLIAWIPFAFLVILSRLYLGVHYLSDIIGGIFVGLVIGDIFHRWSMSRSIHHA